MVGWPEILKFTLISGKDVGMECSFCIPKNFLVNSVGIRYGQQRIPNDRHFVEIHLALFPGHRVQINHYGIGQK
jgi:hypothetical protein